MRIFAEPWLLFLLFFIKIPMGFLLWFLYRTMKRWDSHWENGDYGDTDDPGRGGGGEPRVPLPRGPSSPLMRRRRMRRHRPMPSYRGLVSRRPARTVNVPSTRTPGEARPLRAR